jgi:hypothetical protein
MMLAGCAHSLIVVNAGIGNKTAASMMGAMTPDIYCMALLSTDSLKFRSKPYPQVTAEQADFCHTVTANAKAGK